MCGKNGRRKQTHGKVFKRKTALWHGGHPFFDPPLWRIAGQTLNDYIAAEKTGYNCLQNAHFTKGGNEYLRIPHPEINLAHGL